MEKIDSTNLEDPTDPKDPTDPDDPADPEDPPSTEDPADPEEPADQGLTLTSISISSPPEKTVYARGEDLDLRGLEITGTYSDGSTRIEEVSPENVSGYDNTTAASQTITISIEGKTASFTVTVYATGLYVDISWPEKGSTIVTGFPEGEIRCSKTGTGGLVQEFVLNVEGYRLIECWVDDKKITNSAEGFVIKAVNYAVKEYSITCIGLKEGIPFLMEFPLVVLE
jgi:hypothetical protein